VGKSASGSREIERAELTFVLYESMVVKIVKLVSPYDHAPAVYRLGEGQSGTREVDGAEHTMVIEKPDG